MMAEVDKNVVQQNGETQDTVHVPDVLPVMALKDIVLFPYVIVPLSVGREQSVKAVDQALSENRLILLVTQKDATVESPGEDDLHRVGCVAVIMRMLKLPDGSVKILAQGLSRARVDYLTQKEPYLEARLTRLEEPEVEEEQIEIEALVRSIRQGLERAASIGQQISPDVMLVA